MANRHIIPNVVDDELYFYKEKIWYNYNLRLLNIGLLDLSDNKGLPILFQALEKVSEEDTSWHLDIIGDAF